MLASCFPAGRSFVYFCDVCVFARSRNCSGCFLIAPNAALSVLASCCSAGRSFVYFCSKLMAGGRNYCGRFLISTACTLFVLTSCLCTGGFLIDDCFISMLMHLIDSEADFSCLALIKVYQITFSRFQRTVPGIYPLPTRICLCIKFYSISVILAIFIRRIPVKLSDLRIFDLNFLIFPDFRKCIKINGLTVYLCAGYLIAIYINLDLIDFLLYDPYHAPAVFIRRTGFAEMHISQAVAVDIFFFRISQHGLVTVIESKF